MNITDFTLKNGFKVILVDTKAFPTLTALLLVGAGSRYETTKNNGIAHFFEHMAFKGSKNYPNAFFLSSIIEGLGGEFNAFTDKDYTGYYVKGLSDHFDKIADVIADMIQRPLLNIEEIEREKGVIAQEIGMYEDSPQKKVFELYDELLYKGTPLGMSITGTVDTVKSFTGETFKKYMDSLYHPNNAVFVVAGGLGNNLEKYQQRIEELFKEWNKGKIATFESVKDVQKKNATLTRYKKSEQAHLCVGYRTFSRFDKRKYILWVLSAVLGKGMSSRLFIEVRERRGLAYSIGTYNQLYHELGSMLTYAGVSTDKDKVKEAIRVIVEEHEKLTQQKPSEEELKRAKELIKGRVLLSLEDTFHVADAFGTKMLHEGSVFSIEDMLKAIDSVTSEEIFELAKEIIVKKHLNIALIGPFKSSSHFEIA